MHVKYLLTQCLALTRCLARLMRLQQGTVELALLALNMLLLSSLQERENATSWWQFFHFAECPVLATVYVFECPILATVCPLLNALAAL